MRTLKENRKNRHEDQKNSRAQKILQVNKAKQQSWIMDRQFEKAIQRDL